MGVSRAPSSLGRETGWIVFAKTIGVVGGAATVAVVARLLGPAEFGVLALAVTVSRLAKQLTLAPFIDAAQRFFPVALEEEETAEFAVGLRSASTGPFLWLVAAVVVVDVLLVALGKNRWAVLTTLAVLWGCVFGVAGVCAAVANAGRARHLVALHNTVNQLGKLVFAVAAIAAFGRRSEFVLSGYLASALLLIGVHRYTLRAWFGDTKSGQSNLRRESWHEELGAYAWPFLPLHGAEWLQNSSDRWVLASFRESSAVGTYSAVHQIAFLPMQILAATVAQIASPILFSAAGRASERARIKSATSWNRRLVWTSLALAIVAFLVATQIGDEVVTLVLGARYVEARGVFSILVLAGGLFGAAQLLSLQLMAEIRPRRLSVLKGGAALVGAGLNVIGGYMGGVVGVAYAMLAFAILYLLVMVAGTRVSRPFVR